MPEFALAQAISKFGHHTLDMVWAYARQLAHDLIVSEVSK